MSSVDDPTREGGTTPVASRSHGNMKVKELVKKFETWENNEKMKLVSARKSVSIELNGADPNLPPVTPRGQVRRLRDKLEAKTKNMNSCVIPAKKNEPLRRLQTSFYERADPESTKEAEDTTNEEENQEPYVHVDAYWDAGTEAYWYQNEDGQWLVYDEMSQQFVDPQDAPSLNIPEQVAANVNNPQPYGATPRDSPLRSFTSPQSPFNGGIRRGAIKATDSADRANPLSSSPPRRAVSPRIPETAREEQPPLETTGSLTSRFHSMEGTGDKEEEKEERICVATLNLLNSALSDISARVDVPIQILRKFHLGVQLYALVKSNGGMLKPIILHLAVDRGKLYIVRQGRSRFLTIRHFSECDYSTSCIDFMGREGSKTSAGMRQTIQGLRQQPLVVLWTSNHFSKRPAPKSSDSDGKGEEAASKGMAFVFDNRNLRSEFISVLKAMVNFWLVPKGIAFRFKEKDEVDETLNTAEETDRVGAVAESFAYPKPDGQFL